MRAAEIWKLNYEELKKQLTEITKENNQSIEKEKQISPQLSDEVKELKEKLDNEVLKKERIKEEKDNCVKKIKNLERQVEKLKGHLKNYVKMMEKEANDLNDIVEYDDLPQEKKYQKECKEQTGNLKTKIEEIKSSILEDDEKRLGELSVKAKEFLNKGDIKELNEIISELKEFKEVIADDEMRSVTWNSKTSEAEQLLNKLLEREKVIQEQQFQSYQVLNDNNKL